MKNKKTASPQVDTAKTRQVLLLPGHLFFVESIEVPVELELSDVPDFAELSLESIAPFPIDQLYWGYLYQKDMTTLLLYAAYQGRIKNDGFTDLDDYAWVLPDFAALSGARFHSDTLVLLEGHNSVSLLFFKSDAEAPEFARVDTCIEPLTENTVHTLRSAIPNLPKTTPILHLRPAVAMVNEKGLPTFQHEVAEQNTGSPIDGSWQSLSPSEDRLWQMDVRHADFKKAEQSKRRLSTLIGRVAGWATVFALILAGMEILLLASQSWLNSRLDQIERQMEAVLKVEEKQILVNKLDQVAQNELRPIEMLEAANEIRIQLNLGIEYDSVIIEGENHVTIEGKASSITALNRYVENLKGSGLFELLAEQEPITRNGQTTFRVSLAYSPPVDPSKENRISDDVTTDAFMIKEEVSI